MSADISIPTSYTLTMDGGVDLDLDNIRIKEFPGNPFKTDSKMDMGLDDIRIKDFPRIETDSKVDMGLDDIRVKELPRIEMDTQIAIKPTRVHLPMNYTLSIGVMNMSLLSFSLCGEGMVVIEDFHKHQTEQCA